VEQDALFLTTDMMFLLQQLALEWNETSNTLLFRLIKKEDYERHCGYNAMEGKHYLHVCASSKCFLRNPTFSSVTETEIRAIRPKKREL
jgi:hypothetical protein